MVVFLHQPDCLVSQSVGWFGQSVCLGLYIGWVTQFGFASCNYCWAKATIKIARMTLTIKLDGNWSSFQLANSTPPLSVTGSAIAPSARMVVACAFHVLIGFEHARIHWFIGALLPLCKILDCQNPEKRHNQKKSGMAFSRCILFFYLSV